MSELHRPDQADEAVDLLVVGGGINGAGIARDAAGRGLSVLLVEQHDLAQHTSSSSTKLIHGGLRYLEQYEFGLVRKALIEREVLLRNAPHIMWPLRFVMPHDPSMRPVWMIRLGIFMYDHLARRRLLPGSQTVDLSRHPAGGPLKPRFRKGFVYSDGWVDDARLVVLNALDVAARGGRVLTRTRCEAVRRQADGWRAELRGEDGGTVSVRARALVNAAGPWAARFLHEGAGQPAARALRLIKGSHIVVPRLFDHPFAYIFQNPDGRIVFAIPYEERFTLVGTTDVEHHGDIGAARASDEEVAYLCELISRYFAKPLSPADVVWRYAGVRPLLEDESGDPSAITRDYALELDTQGGAPLLSVWGGKITTYRKLAEEAMDRLRPLLPGTGDAWTAGVPLPGGDLPVPAGAPEAAFATFLSDRQARLAWMPPALLHRLARAHGSRLDRVIGGAARLAELGEEVAPGLFEAELRYLVDEEWARTAEDVLWRRTKLGLHLDASGREDVARWFARHAVSAAPANARHETARTWTET